MLYYIWASQNTIDTIKRTATWDPKKSIPKRFLNQCHKLGDVYGLFMGWFGEEKPFAYAQISQQKEEGNEPFSLPLLAWTLTTNYNIKIQVTDCYDFST